MAGLKSTGPVTVAQLRQRIAGLAEPRFRADLSRVLAAAAGKLVNDGFLTSTDPYGNPWAPLRHRDGKPLLLTGRMRASVASIPMNDGFRIDTTASYAPFHQYGGKRGGHRAARVQAVRRGRFISRVKASRFKGKSIGVRFLPETTGGLPQRQMIPMAETGGIPPKWVQVFDRETSDLVERTLRR